MKIKIIEPTKSKYLFESELNKWLEKGYKIIASNTFADREIQKRWIFIGYKTTIMHEIYYYALLQKEDV